MEIERLIANFYAKIQLETVPQKGQQGFYEIALAGSPPVSVKELTSGPGLFFLGYLLPNSDQKTQESLFIYLMKANFLGQGTGRAAIGIDSSEKFFVLTQTLSYAVDDKAFYETLENFLNYMDFWREAILRVLKEEKIL